MAASIYDWSVTPSGNATADADINWSEGMFPSVVNDSARQMMGRLAEYVGDNGVLPDIGTANVIKIATKSNLTSPPNGMTVAFKAAFSNTGAVTLSINAGASIKLRKVFAGQTDATDLDANDITAKGIYIAHFDQSANAGAGAWILINPTNYVATAGSVINATNKNTPADTDSFVGVTAAGESSPASLFKSTWGNIKSVLRDFFDARYILTDNPVVTAVKVDFINTGNHYEFHRSSHVAYVKKLGSERFSWRANSTGASGGAGEVTLMSLTDGGLLTDIGSIEYRSGTILQYDGNVKGAAFNGGYLTDFITATATDRANAAAATRVTPQRCGWDTAVIEFGTVDPGFTNATLDLPAPYVVVGLRSRSGSNLLNIRGAILKNNGG